MLLWTGAGGQQNSRLAAAPSRNAALSAPRPNTSKLILCVSQHSYRGMQFPLSAEGCWVCPCWPADPWVTGGRRHRPPGPWTAADTCNVACMSECHTISKLPLFTAERVCWLRGPANWRPTLLDVRELRPSPAYLLSLLARFMQRECSALHVKRCWVCAVCVLELKDTGSWLS